MEEQIQKLLIAAQSSYNSGDMKSAFESYREAAIKGSGEASYHLGSFYEKGIYVDRNFKAAMEWYFTSAKKGYKKATEKLGIKVPLNVTKNDTTTDQTPQGKTSLEDEQHNEVINNDEHEIHKPRESLFWFFVAIGAIILIILATFLHINSSNKNVAEKHLPEYYSLVNECNNLTKQDSDEGLLNAKSKLREIKELEIKYADILPSEYNKSRTFGELESLLKHRSSEWTAKALAQIGDINTAKSCLLMAKKFCNNESINLALELLDNNPSDKVEIQKNINQAINELK